MKSKQFGILGLGHFGEALALELTNLGADVIVIDKSEERIQNIANEVTYAVQADVADLNALQSIGLKNVDTAVISITSDINANLMAIINCQQLEIPQICSKVNNAEHTKVLEHLGVNEIFNPEEEMGKTIAQRLYNGSFLHALTLDSNYSIVEVNALKAWQSKRLNELDLRSRFGITVVAIVHDNQTNIAPAPNDIIYPGSKLIVLGENSAIDNIKKMSLDGK